MNIMIMDLYFIKKFKPHSKLTKSKGVFMSMFMKGVFVGFKKDHMHKANYYWSEMFSIMMSRLI